MNHLISSHLDAKINPMGAVRQTQADRWKKRPSVLRYRAFGDELRLAAAAQNFVLGERCILIFEIEMPKSWSKKKKELHAGKPHKSKPDNDNAVKSCLDHLCIDGGDAFVHTVFAAKFWGYEGRIRIYNTHGEGSDLNSLLSRIEGTDKGGIYCF